MQLKAVKLVIVCTATVILSVFAHSALAQDEGESQETSPPAQQQQTKASKGEKRKTKIDFEDELVEGELKKPELFYILQKKQFNYKRLIKLREDFLPEMRRDAEEVRRARSKN